jgi:hypothetical protein
MNDESQNDTPIERRHRLTPIRRGIRALAGFVFAAAGGVLLMRAITSICAIDGGDQYAAVGVVIGVVSFGALRFSLRYRPLADNRCPSPAAAILAAVLVLVAIFGLYVGGYYAMGRKQYVSWYIEGHAAFSGWYRVYRYEWLKTVYTPMAWVESRATGHDVVALSESDLKLLNP